MKLLAKLRSLWPFVSKNKHDLSCRIAEGNYQALSQLFTTTKEVQKNQISNLTVDLRKTEVELNKVSTLLRHIRDTHPEACKFRGAGAIQMVEDHCRYVALAVMKPVKLYKESLDDLTQSVASKHERVEFHVLKLSMGLAEGCPLEYVMDDITHKVQEALYHHFERNVTHALARPSGTSPTY